MAPQSKEPSRGWRSARRYALCALLLLGAGLAAAAAAHALSESEPNNDLFTADSAAVATAITGYCSNGDDDYVRFFSPASRLVHIDYSSGDGISISFFDPTGQKTRETLSDWQGELGFVAPVAGNYSVELTSCYSSTGWSVTFSDAGPWAQNPGEADVEPNDLEGSESMYAPGAGRGQLDPVFDPLDKWFIPVSTTSVVRVAVVSGNNSTAWVTGDTKPAYILSHSGLAVVMAAVAPPGANITVFAGTAKDSYTLEVLSETSGEPFFEGPSEVEPNGAESNATRFEAKEQVTLSGLDHGALDATDIYTTELGRAAIVSVSVATDYQCYSYYGCPPVRIQSAGAVDVQSFTNGGCCFNSSGRYILEAHRQYFFRVWTTDTQGPYNVTLQFQFAQVPPHSQLSIVSAAGSNLIDVFTMRAGNGFGARTDLSEAALGTSYGQTLNIAIQNLEPVPLLIEITAGTKWRPQFGGFGDFFTTRTTIVSVAPGDSNSAIVFAAAGPSSGPNPGFMFSFDLNGTAEGAMGALIAAMATGEFSPRAEATAIWALANSWDRGPLHQQGASDAVIDEANRIFAKAKVPSPITSLSDGQVWSIALAGGAGAALTLAGAFAAVRRGRRPRPSDNPLEAPASK